jgi:DNA-binding protein HU-beta
MGALFWRELNTKTRAIMTRTLTECLFYLTEPHLYPIIAPNKSNSYRNEAPRAINKEHPMNKKELVAAISNTSGLSKADSETALNAVISCLTDLLAKGDSIVLPGFASLSVKERPARTGRNPATGQPIEIAASKALSFKTGTKLKEAINGQ